MSAGTPPLLADYVDGRTAAVHRAALTLDTGADPALRIVPPGQSPLRWRLGDIRQLPDQARDTGIALTSAGTPLARLYIAEPGVAAEIARLCPRLNAAPPVAGRRRIAAWGFGAVASVALIIFVLVPLLANQLATVLPPRGEKALGDATLEQVRRAFSGDSLTGALPVCDTPQGRAALDRIQARIAGQTDLPYALTVTVLDHDMINAFALPGGHIVFFRGIIDAADSPDEIAAVFAHELGHVVARDPVRIALRSAGSIGVLGLLLGDFAGGALVLFVTERLIEASYTRDAEAAADAFAHRVLTDAGIRPDGLADLFETLRAEHGDTGGLVAHFMSHPALGDRIEAAREATRQAADTAFTPALGKTGWRSLKAICD